MISNIDRNRCQYFRHVSAFLMFAMVCGVAFRANADDTSESFQPDDRTQRLIRLIAGQGAGAEQGLEMLKQRSKEDPQAMVGQLIHYTANADPDDFNGSMAAYVLPEILEIRRNVLAEVAISRLQAGDENTKKVARRLIGAAEDASVERPPDFSIHAASIATALRQGEEPPSELIRMMIMRDSPGPGLLAVSRAYGPFGVERRPLLWADHIVGNVLWKKRYGFPLVQKDIDEAIEQLDLLAKHPQWWARLYAAHVMRRNPELLRRDS